MKPIIEFKPSEKEKIASQLDPNVAYRVVTVIVGTPYFAVSDICIRIDMYNSTDTILFNATAGKYIKVTSQDNVRFKRAFDVRSITLVEDKDERP